MIFLDVETTGLVLPAPALIDDQPRIIEFGAIRLDNKFKEIGRLSFMANPGIELPPIITKITGITARQVSEAQPFLHNYPAVVDLFEGETVICAHNCSFDTNLLFFELIRMGMEKKFPWPRIHVCTVEQTMQINNKRMKLENLYKYLFKADPKQTHRAIGDVELLIKVYKELVKREMIEPFHK